jgi:glyoxylase-like metal-dependent hydrolase (beta-lactamase superfamily II)
VQTIEKLKLKIGNYEVCPLPTGIFGLDGGAMFGTVPKVLWEKSNPADHLNRIEMEARCLLLKSQDLNILIDTGNGGDFITKYGDKLGSKFAEMYNIQGSSPAILKSLSQQGLQAEDIHVVILTHLHFDHAGGATTEKNGKLVPTFPNAKYFVQKDNLATARNPNLREKASYFSANFEPLIESNVLTLLDGPTEDLFPGISLLVSNGHTQGQQVVKISDDQNSLLYCADLVPTSSHVRLPWLMGYDLHPLLLMEEKSEILGKAADHNWHLYFEHDPYCDTALIERKGNDFQVKARYQIG